jgi:hypothetical protein
VGTGDSLRERRARGAQREAVDSVLPDDGSVLRTASGEVVVYAEQDEKRRPVELRAVVMPDGELQELASGRFKRR